MCVKAAERTRSSTAIPSNDTVGWVCIGDSPATVGQKDLAPTAGQERKHAASLLATW
jgi:hypothetical protein